MVHLLTKHVYIQKPVYVVHVAHRRCESRSALLALHSTPRNDAGLRRGSAWSRLDSMSCEALQLFFIHACTQAQASDMLLSSSPKVSGAMNCERTSLSDSTRLARNHASRAKGLHTRFYICARQIVHESYEGGLEDVLNVMI